VAQACYLSYSGGREQEDPGLKPDQANSLQDPIKEKRKIKTTELEEWLMWQTTCLASMRS
jgi:hypothetical protein